MGGLNTSIFNMNRTPQLQGPRMGQNVLGSPTASNRGRNSGFKLDSYKKGGKVKKTGLAKLHKGELVLTKKQAKKLKKKKKSKGMKDIAGFKLK